jgi:S-formylglutathione hydrolase
MMLVAIIGTALAFHATPNPRARAPASGRAGVAHLSETAITELSRVPVAGGTLVRFRHDSSSTGTPMTAAVFLPPGAEFADEVPALYWLSGLTCTDENFCIKAGAFVHAAKARLALVVPDTSPRGAAIEGEDESYDLGTGAGFYVDATEAPWSSNYKMYSYVTYELPALVEEHFQISHSLRSISGHSMGGHGALTVAFKAPEEWASVSAFAPICNPTACGWGQKAFSAYLGSVEAGEAHSAAALLAANGPFPGLGEILIDQGADDEFLEAGQLQPEALEEAATAVGQPILLRTRPGDHVRFHLGQTWLCPPRVCMRAVPLPRPSLPYATSFQC